MERRIAVGLLDRLERLERRIAEVERRERERRDCSCVLGRRDAVVASALTARCSCCELPRLGTAQDGPFCECDAEDGGDDA